MKNATINVLLIEDDKIDQIAFKDVVATKQLPYDYTIAGSVSETKNFLPSNRFDVIIADYMLGDGTVFDLFVLIGNAPIIFVTGAGNEHVTVKAMKMGVYDYLVKDFKRQYLKKLPTVIEKAYQYKSFAQPSKPIKKSINKVVLSKVIENIVFYTSKLGSSLAYRPKKNLFLNKDLEKIGIFFYLAIGQGNVRNYGLFELPVPGFPTYRSFVYSFEVKDLKNEDPRSKGKKYCLLAFFFPTGLREYFLHPYVLEKIIRGKMTNFTSIEHLPSQGPLQKIVSTIIQ